MVASSASDEEVAGSGKPRLRLACLTAAQKDAVLELEAASASSRTVCLGVGRFLAMRNQESRASKRPCQSRGCPVERSLSAHKRPISNLDACT